MAGDGPPSRGRPTVFVEIGPLSRARPALLAAAASSVKRPPADPRATLAMRAAERLHRDVGAMADDLRTALDSWEETLSDDRPGTDVARVLIAGIRERWGLG